MIRQHINRRIREGKYTEEIEAVLFLIGVIILVAVYVVAGDIITMIVLSIYFYMAILIKNVINGG